MPIFFESQRQMCRWERRHGAVSRCGLWAELSLAGSVPARSWKQEQPVGSDAVGTRTAFTNSTCTCTHRQVPAAPSPSPSHLRSQCSAEEEEQQSNRGSIRGQRFTVPALLLRCWLCPEAARAPCPSPAVPCVGHRAPPALTGHGGHRARPCHLRSCSRAFCPPGGSVCRCSTELLVYALGRSP